MIEAKTLSTARPLELRIDEFDYRIDTSDTQCRYNLQDTLSFLPDNNLLP